MHLESDGAIKADEHNRQYKATISIQSSVALCKGTHLQELGDGDVDLAFVVLGRH